MQQYFKSPKHQGYARPPEWHPHVATQLHWPHNRQTWPGSRLDKVEKVYLQIINVLHQYEPIHLLVDNQEMETRVRTLLKKQGINLQQIIFHLQPTNDVWARDCGPIFIRREINGAEEFAITDWEYNAWGGKYPPFDDDNNSPKYFADYFDIKRFKPGMVLEGGSIETNGKGVLLTTESVLLNENRNPGLSKNEIEQRLRDYLGVQKIIWLKRGLAGDDTDGHIDDLSRFLNKETILTMVTKDPADINYNALQENVEILQKATDQFGNPFNIETLSLPNTRIDNATVDGSKHVPASYANFYIANGVVLVPVFNHQYDEKALELLSRYFPQRDIYGIPCQDLVWGQGGIHCITQQLYGL